MRRFPALLVAAGLATAPASVAAGPSKDPSSTPQAQTVEKFEWSTAKGRLGVMVMGLTPALRKHFGAPEDRGVLVANVNPTTPAAAAGIQVGDVIVEVHGTKIDSAPDVLTALADVGKGDRAKIALVRDRKSLTLDATLSDNAPRTMWSPWFRTPFDESWFRDWLRPFDPPRTDKRSFIDTLRDLFAPEKDGTANKQS
jgi:membrane-associated protease RseP (regulator of RpoE activity)